jgi:hypothetical protein
MFGWSSALAALASAKIFWIRSLASSSHSGTSNLRNTTERFCCGFLAWWTTPTLPRGSSLTSSRLAVRGAAAVAEAVAVAVAVPVAVSGFSCIVGFLCKSGRRRTCASYPEVPPDVPIRTLPSCYRGNCGISD